MLHLRRAAPLLAAATLTLGLGTAIAATPVTPASALVFTQQCDPSGDCMNFWGGQLAVKTYDGTTANNSITIHWLSGGGFELRDNLHGGCIADYGGSPTLAYLGGGLSCPSLGKAPYGSIWTVYAQCGNGFSLYRNKHWGGNLKIGTQNGQAVYANGNPGTCVKQESLYIGTRPVSTRFRTPLEPLSVVGPVPGTVPARPGVSTAVWFAPSTCTDILL